MDKEFHRKALVFALLLLFSGYLSYCGASPPDISKYRNFNNSDNGLGSLRETIRPCRCEGEARGNLEVILLDCFVACAPRNDRSEDGVTGSVLIGHAAKRGFAPLRAVSPEGDSLPDYSKDPVVFVHGLFGRTWNFNTLKARLVANGWQEEHLFAIDYSDRFGCNKQSAGELSVFVDSVLARTGAEKVDIIAHSMGGLSARYFIKHLGGDEKVRDVVTLGSPHHGVRLNYYIVLPIILFPLAIIYYDTTTKQIMAGSDFLNNLKAVDETPGDDIRWTSIWSRADLIVRPSESSVLAGAWNVHLERIGHVSLLLDKERVFPVIKQALTGGGKNDN